MTDDTVTELAAGSRSRAVAAGIDGYEFDEVVASIAAIEEWPPSFRLAATRHLTAGQAAEAAGRRETATERYRAAATWFYFAQAWPTAEAQGYLDAAEAQWRALVTADEGAVRLRGENFRGVLRRPVEPVTSDTLAVLVSGLDGAKEEQLAVSDALLARGVSTLAIDGPAQGELTTVLPFPEHFAGVVSEALDRLQDVEPSWRPSAIGIWGSSLGGHYTMATLGREPRLRAGVVVSGFAKASWDSMGPYVRSLAELRAGGKEAARDFANGLDAEDDVKRITAPVFIVDGGEDPLVNGDFTGAWMAEQIPDATRRLIEQGDHNVANARWLWLTDAADWMAEQLRGSVR